MHISYSFTLWLKLLSSWGKKMRRFPLEGRNYISFNNFMPNM